MSDLYQWAAGGAVTAVFGALALALVRKMQRAFRELVAHLAHLAQLPAAVEHLSTEVRAAKIQVGEFSDRLEAIERFVDEVDNVVIIGNERRRE